ncbi:MAG: type II toxin-antitoxin system RelE/ParE family toxin [Planctomycetaceae bacterium]|jgi:toxin YoeB|nr:type II toxin-antitoxin system RelE/ParE family toxin [Planctomycetaceae bacterium]
MARKRLIWTDSAEQELGRILHFFRERNGNSTYSKKLKLAFTEITKMIRDYEEIGIKYNDENVRYVIVEGTYQLFYEITEHQITILKVWDARRNPDSLELN